MMMQQLVSGPPRDFPSSERERTAWKHVNQQARKSQPILRQSAFDCKYPTKPPWSLQSWSEPILTDRQGGHGEAFPNTQEGKPGREWIQAAMMELDCIDEEVAEEALPEIRSDTKATARKIIFALMDQPIAPTVYPTSDAEIALYFKSPATTSSVLLLVGNDGQAACFSYIHGKNRRARYEDASEIPDEFVRAQLRALKEQSFSKGT